MYFMYGVSDNTIEYKSTQSDGSAGPYAGGGGGVEGVVRHPLKQRGAREHRL